MKRAVCFVLEVASLVGGCASPPPPLPLSATSPTTPPPIASTTTAPAAAIDPSGKWDVRWDPTIAGWSAGVLEGTMSLDREADRWTGKLSFDHSGPTWTLQSLHVDGDHLQVVFHARSMQQGGLNPDVLELSARIRDRLLVGEARSERIPWTPFGGRPFPRLHPGAADHGMAKMEEAAGGANPAALRTLTDHGEDEHSSAIVLARDGKVFFEAYGEGYDGGPLLAMSASKSVVSLAVGLLVSEGKLALDTTMGSLFPSRRATGAKARITVRQLLNHTSGLDPSRADWQTETIRQHALDAKLAFPPGTRFQYDNDAVDLLALVVKQAAGVPLDEYVETHLFRKLGVVGASWWKDSEGTPRAAGELQIRPVDLVKIGQMMLDGGRWQGEQVVPRDWIDQSMRPGQPFREDCGLLWWREGAFSQTLTETILAAWREAGIDATAVRAAHPLLGKKYANVPELFEALKLAIGVPAAVALDVKARKGHLPVAATVGDGPARGFSAQGSYGQYLVVLPEKRLVAVRMRQPTVGDYQQVNRSGVEPDTYGGFSDDVAKLF
jgi:CubicO group peptidase (beta-lactamase class C family)